MKIFRYKEDRLPIAIVFGVFLIDLIVYFSVDQTPVLFGWMCAALLIKLFIAAWNHHHQHVNTFRQTLLNRLLEIVYTFHTGISTNVWVLHHNLGHHLNYLDQTKDESGWRRKDQSKMGVWEYTFTVGITGYFRAIRIGKDYPKFQKSLVGMGVFNIILLALLLRHSPINALIVFVTPMLLIYLGTCWNTYYHHAGLETEDHLHASHNITNRFYNIISGNLGYHTAHHMKQGLHWSQLPEFHKTIENEIPSELISSDFPVIGSFIAMIWS